MIGSYSIILLSEEATEALFVEQLVHKVRLFSCIADEPNLPFRSNSLPEEVVEQNAAIIIVKHLIQGCNNEVWVRVEAKASNHGRCIITASLFRSC